MKFLNITHMSSMIARTAAMWQAYITLSEESYQMSTNT